MKESLKEDLKPQAKNLTMPVLMIVGEKDETCPPDHQRILYDLIPGPKEFNLIQGAPHLFLASEHIEQLKLILSRWIKSIN